MKKIISHLKSCAIASFLVLSFSACSPKVWDYSIRETTPEISDEQLKKMTVKEYFNFMRVKNVRDYVPEMTYSYADSYESAKRYCKLKNSELKFFNPIYKDLDIAYCEGTLERYNRRMDFPVSYGCYINESDEFFTLTRLTHFVVTNGVMSNFEVNHVMNLSNRQKPWYFEFLESEETKFYSRFERGDALEGFLKDSKALRNRKGTFTAIIYETKNMLNVDCASVCRKLNIIDNGYAEKRFLQSDNWKVIENLEAVTHKVNSSCSCSGYKLTIKR